MKYLFIFTFVFLMYTLHVHSEEDIPAQDFELEEIYVQIKKLLLTHYPKATSSLVKNKIQFEFNTRLFTIHVPLKTGEWQDPWEEKGPNTNGILCSIELRKGTYDGQALLPQSFDKFYFKTYVRAPYSKKRDSHLYIKLTHPKNGINQEFSKDLNQILASFSQESKPADKQVIEKQSLEYASNYVTHYSWYRDQTLEKDLIQDKNLKEFPSAGSMITFPNGIATKAIVIENNKISINTSGLKLEFNEDETKDLLKGKLVQKGNNKYAVFLDFEAKRDHLHIHVYNPEGKLIDLHVFFKLKNEK